MHTIESYWANEMNTIEGGFEKSMLEPLQLINRFQKENKIGGSVMEIGVHHGKFFIPLMLLTEKGESAVGIDIFEDQEKNIDDSGKGDLEIVQSNIERLRNPWNKVDLIKRDSLTLNALDKVELLQKYGPFRIVSIDGVHTVYHTVNDLLFAQDVMQGGGVVLVDDYTNIHWPGVHEGVAHFFLENTPKIRVFASARNKLFLTDLTYYRRYFNLFHEAFCNARSFKKVRLWNSETLVFL